MDLEQRQLRDGEYVAVRRFTRILERGPDAKATVDEVGAVGGGILIHPGGLWLVCCWSWRKGNTLTA